jgi:hypothetical protein
MRAELEPRGTLLAIALIVGLRPCATAQVGPPPSATVDAALPLSGPAGPRRPFDQVRAIVGDRVILESTVRSKLAARPEFGRLDAAQRQQLERNILQSMLREELWVQVGKTVLGDDAETFDKMVEMSVDERMREMHGQFGSFSRMNQELEALGTTWQSVRNEERQQQIRATAQAAARRNRFGESMSLLVTPAEIADFYRRNLDKFAAFQAGDVASVAFPKSRPNARESATAAAAAWATETLTAVELADRLQGVALPDQNNVIPEDPAEKRPKLIREFVGRSAEGAVEGPIDRGDVYLVLKLPRKVDQPARSLDDLEVQSLIRRALVETKIASLEEGILRWKASQIVTFEPARQ